MKDFFLQRRIDRLEEEGNNDALLIMEFGAQSYSTSELSIILDEVIHKKNIAGRWQNRLFMVGFSVSLWLAAAFLAAAFDASLLSFLLLSLVPISLIFALVGHYFLRKQFPAFRDIHLVASIIQQELDWRKKNASIF